MNNIENLNSAIIIVDPQRDFEQHGSLCVTNDANNIYIKINKLLKLFNIQIASQDYHGKNHSSFVNLENGEIPFVTIKNIVLPDDTIFKQKCWPSHCVKKTNGVKFSESFIYDPKKLRIVRKGIYDKIESYSAMGDSTEEKKFEKTLLLEHLKENKVKNVYLCGLAFDYCVGSTALDLAKYGFNIYILTDCTRYVFQKNCDDITNNIFSTEESYEMYQKLCFYNVNFITSNELLNKSIVSIELGNQLLPIALLTEDI